MQSGLFTCREDSDYGDLDILQMSATKIKWACTSHFNYVKPPWCRWWYPVAKFLKEIPTKNYKLFQFEFLNVFHDEVVADLKRWMFEKTNLSVSTCSIQKSSSSSAWECHLLKLSIVHKSIAYHFNKEFMEIMIHDPTSRFYIRILEMIHNRVPYKKLFSQYILDDSFSPIFKVVKYIKGEHYHTIWFLGSAKYLSSSK